VPTTHIDIHHVARLARIRLTEAEAEAYSAELDRIVHYFESLQSLSLPAADALADAPSMPVALREDRPGEALPRALALAGAPQHDGSAFVVPKVV